MDTAPNTGAPLLEENLTNAYLVTNEAITALDTAIGGLTTTAGAKVAKAGDTMTGDLIATGHYVRAKHKSDDGSAGKTINVDLGGVTQHFKDGLLVSVTENAGNTEVVASTVVASTAVTS